MSAVFRDKEPLGPLLETQCTVRARYEDRESDDQMSAVKLTFPAVF